MISLFRGGFTALQGKSVLVHVYACVYECVFLSSLPGCVSRGSPGLLVRVQTYLSSSSLSTLLEPIVLIFIPVDAFIPLDLVCVHILRCETGELLGGV